MDLQCRPSVLSFRYVTRPHQHTFTAYATLLHHHALSLLRQTALLPRTHTTSAALHQPDVQTLQLTNQELVPVAFKMQTNRPKRYNVGPVQGILGPGETQNIEIHMKPLEVRAVWYGLSERRP